MPKILKCVKWKMLVLGLAVTVFGFTWADQEWLGDSIGFFGSACTAGIGTAMAIWAVFSGDETYA